MEVLLYFILAMNVVIGLGLAYLLAGNSQEWLVQRRFEKGQPLRGMSSGSMKAELDDVHKGFERLPVMKYKSFQQVDCNPVPGIGPILALYKIGDCLYAIRSDGVNPIAYRGSNGAWEKVDIAGANPSSQ